MSSSCITPTEFSFSYIQPHASALLLHYLICVGAVFASVRALVEDAACAAVSQEWLQKHETLMRNLIRLGLLSIICAVAFGVKNFGNMVSLTGGVFMTVTGLIIPPVLYNRVHDIATHTLIAGSDPLIAPPVYTTTEEREQGNLADGACVLPPLSNCWRFLHISISGFGLVLMGLSSYYTMTHF